ncbi:hypothetical protein IF1G_11185 [Cordyceps javanica]|uniref:Uncharacterized protein n=1 Tax=Cordyceps javanica TaxID=43265 RepID=A0A545UL04_9HYPO|nr:hypothetical protein IF1G_11185 [Cordyceps javanica]
MFKFTAEGFGFDFDLACDLEAQNSCLKGEDKRALFELNKDYRQLYLFALWLQDEAAKRLRGRGIEGRPKQGENLLGLNSRCVRI